MWLSSVQCRQLSIKLVQLAKPVSAYTIVNSMTTRPGYLSSPYARKLLGLSSKGVYIPSRGKGYQATRDSDFKEIYRFRYIMFTRLVSNLKVYQTGLTVLAAPFMVYFYSTGTISQFEATVFLGITSFACLMLYIMSDFFRRIACVIYLNEKTNTVEISHMSFWARRRDKRFDLDDIKPLSDTKEKSSSFFVRLETYSSGQTFYLFPRHGLVKEPESFQNLIGLKFS